MINLGTYLDVRENSGAKKLQCIKVLNKSRKKAASIGDSIIVSICQKIIKKKSKIKSKTATAVIVNVKKTVKKKNGNLVRSGKNTAILVNNQKAPLATRILGFVPYEVKLQGYSKLISIANKCI